MKTPFHGLDARALTRLGMLCLLLFFGLNSLLRRWAGASWTDVLDGASGVALGAAIAFVLLAARARGRRLQGAEARPCG